MNSALAYYAETMLGEELARDNIERRMWRDISEIILSQDDNAIRFENFCAALCEKTENETFLTTSRSFDQGRDAISIGRSRGSHRNIVLCTLERNVKKKLIADITKLAKTSKPDRIVYCCNSRLSQYANDNLTNIIRGKFPSSSVRVYGVAELASLVNKISFPLDEYYGGELKSVNKAASASDAEKKGLTLALAVLGSDDAKKLRSEVSVAALLSILKKQPCSLSEIASALSNDLHLPKRLNLEYIKTITDECAFDGLIEEKDQRWALTAVGQQRSASLTTSAASQLLTGRALIRQKLETSLGRKLSDKHYEMMWSTLQDFFAELFYSNGLVTICAVNEILLAKAPGAANNFNLKALVSAGAAKVGATTTDPQSRDELERAVLDIFTERTGEAFEWLAGVAERFVALCALGLEATSAEEIRKILARYQLTLDTDIVLTYLCAGEPDHEAARELLDRWLSINGDIVFTQTVLEEVANHAWIANKHFKPTVHLLGQLKEEDLPHYTDNAFVRAFHAVAESEKDKAKWPKFIDQYRGSRAEDYSNIFEILADELRATALSEKFDDKLASQISKFLQQQIVQKKQEKKNEKRIDSTLTAEEAGKAKRDGELLATIASTRQLNLKAGLEKTVVAISSSGRLRNAYERFRAPIGNPDAVMSLSALSYLLAMLPENPLGAGSLRRALFDITLQETSSQAQQLALQIIKAAGTFEIPAARRVTLRRSLEKSIRNEAERRGLKPGEFERQFVTHDGKVPYSEIIGAAVKQMAASSPDVAQRDARIRELEQRIDELEIQLEEKSKPAVESQ